jgi:O-antigen/teichoic acid export membrane protein
VNKPKSFGASAASGMMWTSISVLLTKSMLLLMQFVLGFLLDPRDYSIFAEVSVALTFVVGLQNTGAGKLLIQQREKTPALLKEYSDFALYMGLIGAVLLVILGFALGAFYRNPDLIYVVALSAISVPLTSLISIQFATLSIDLRFRAMCVIDLYVAAVQVAVVIGAAYLGASYYSLAIGLVVSTILRYLLNRRVTPTSSASFALPRQTFFSILGQVKWLIVTGFLSGLSQQGDYFVLGRIVSPETLGYYYFGFQLTANVGQLLAQGIGNTLFPIFTAMKQDAQALGRAFLRSGSVIHFVCSLLCLGIVGFAPWLIHFIWRGKWDLAIITAVAMAISLPMRMLSPLAAATLDSFGKWRLRTGLLILDSGSMMLAAFIGASLGDLTGASIGVAVQRFASGMVDFFFGLRVLRRGSADILLFALKAFLPFWVCAAALVTWNAAYPLQQTGLETAVLSLGRTFAAVLGFTAISYALDRTVVAEVVALVLRIAFRRQTPQLHHP